MDTVLQSDRTTSAAVFASSATAHPRLQNRARKQHRSSGEIAHLTRPPASAADADRLRRHFPGSPWSGAANPAVIRSGFHAYSERANGLPRMRLKSTVWISGRVRVELHPRPRKCPVGVEHCIAMLPNPDAFSRQTSSRRVGGGSGAGARHDSVGRVESGDTGVPPRAAIHVERGRRNPLRQYCWPRSQREQMSTWHRPRTQRNRRASSIAPPGGERRHRTGARRRHLRIGNNCSGGKHVLGGVARTIQCVLARPPQITSRPDPHHFSALFGSHEQRQPSHLHHARTRGELWVPSLLLDRISGRYLRGARLQTSVGDFHKV